MSKICQNCGNSCEDTAVTCPSCGTQLVSAPSAPATPEATPVAPVQAAQVENAAPVNPTVAPVQTPGSEVTTTPAPTEEVPGTPVPPVQPSVTPSAPSLKNRNIAVSIILSFVTCGIYGLYWFVCLTNETNSVSENNKTYEGIVALLLSIITCNLYGLYWNYKLGKKMYDAGVKYGKNFEDNSVLYLILSLFGLGIVNYCLVQSELNQLAGE